MSVCILNKRQLNQLVKLADQHREQDEYISGTYERRTGKKWLGGCMIGCTIHDAIGLGLLPKKCDRSSHSDIAKATGVPRWIWRTADYIFEGLSDKLKPAWTPALLRTIKPRVDYSGVWPRFAIYILRDCRKHARVDGQAAIDRCIAAYRRVICGEVVGQSEWDSIRAAANAAADAAYAAYAADAAAYAADAAAYAADAANAAHAAAYAAYAARCRDWKRYSVKLLKLMAEAGEV